MKLVENLVDNYKNHQLYSIENSPTFPMVFDARAASFSLAELKSFIETIEKEVAKHPEAPVEKIGVRFYYAAYPDVENWEEDEYNDIEIVPTDYAKLHTLIAVPTTEINGVECDFDPYDVATYNGSKPSDSGLAIMAENHGTLSPPKSVSGLWF